MSTFLLGMIRLQIKACPFLVPLLAYMSGLLIFEVWPEWFRVLHYGYTAAVLLVFLAPLFWSERGDRRGKNTVFYLGGSWFLLALSFSQYLYTKNLPEEAFATEATHSYRGYVLETPQRSRYGAGYWLKIQADVRYTQSGHFYPIKEKVRVYYYSIRCALKTGDELWIKGAPRRITSKIDQENSQRYVSYQARKGFYFADRTSPKHLIPTGKIRGNKLWVQAQRLQARLKRGLEAHLSPSAAPLAQGLLLGDKAAIEIPLRKAFLATGSMHVLAVSGLHVGILYAIWLFWASFLPLARYALGLRLLIAVIGLWGFAFVVGLSASVLRATTLCTFWVASTWLGRRGNSYNSLFAAALCILLFDPQALFSLSFQLSFLAVLGILLFYRPLYGLLSLRHRLWKGIWGIICVSLAAQTAVLPLVLYHFGMCSLVFPLTSTVITPLLFLILPLSLGVALLSPWAGIAKGLAWLLEPLLQTMRGLLQYMAQWPGSHLYPIYLDEVQLWLLYGALGAGVCFWIRRRPVYILLCAGLLLIQGVLHWQASQQLQNTQKLRLSVDRKQSLLLQHFDRGLIYQTKATETDIGSQRFLEKHGYISALASWPRARQPLLPVIDGLLYASMIGEQRLLWLKRPAHLLQKNPIHLPVLKTNYLVLSSQSLKDVPYVLSQFRFQRVILAGRSSRVAEALRIGSGRPLHLLGKSDIFEQNLQNIRP